MSPPKLTSTHISANAWPIVVPNAFGWRRQKATMCPDQSGVTMLTLDLRDSLIIVGIGVSLGLAGSWMAAARHMRSIEPK